MQKILYLSYAILLWIGSSFVGCIAPHANPNWRLPVVTPTTTPTIFSTPVNDMAPAVSPLPAPLPRTSSLTVAGSSDWARVMQQMIRRFADEGDDGGNADAVSWDTVGTPGSIERLCNSAVDLIGVIRPLTLVETQECQAKGATPVALPLGYAAIAVIVNRENTFVTNLTTEELTLIFSDFVTWAEINPHWPQTQILIPIPTTDRWLFDLVIEQLFEGNLEPLLDRPGVWLSDTDDEWAHSRTVESDSSSIALISYPVYTQVQESVKLVTIENIPLTEETLRNGSYSLMRPLLLYTTTKALQEKPHLALFLNYMLTHGSEEMIKENFWPVPPEEVARARQILGQAMSGQ